MLSTTCRLCNKEIAQAPLPLNIPLEGQPDWQALQYLMLLQKHLQKRHPENAQALTAAAQEFGGMLLIQCYRIDDPSVTARADLIRDTFISQFARQVSDDELAALVSRFELPPAQHAQMIELATSLRDLFTCRGKYAPKSGTLTEVPVIIAP